LKLRAGQACAGKIKCGQSGFGYEIETANGHWIGGRGGDLLRAGLHLHVAAGGEVLLELASFYFGSKCVRK